MREKIAAHIFETSSGAGRLILAFRVGSAALVACATLYVSWGGDPDWLNRSGIVLVVISLVLTYYQFWYEANAKRTLAFDEEHSRRIIEEKGVVGPAAEQILQSASKSAMQNFELIRSRIFLNSIAIAAGGEILHGFGSVAWKAVVD